MGIYEELEWRGLVKDVSDPILKEKLNKGGMTFYIGPDQPLVIQHFYVYLNTRNLMLA